MRQCSSFIFWSFVRAGGRPEIRLSFRQPFRHFAQDQRERNGAGVRTAQRPVTQPAGPTHTAYHVGGILSGPLGCLRRLRNDQGQVCRCIKTGKRQVCAVDGIEDGFVAWLCLARLGNSRFHGAEHVPELGGSKVLSPTKRVAPAMNVLPRMTPIAPPLAFIKATPASRHITSTPACESSSLNLPMIA